MGYIGNEPTTGHFPVDNFTSSGGSTYTLAKAPASAGAIEVSVQGVLQPTTAYTVSGTTLTMAGVTSGVKIFVRHLGETLSLPTPADGSVTAAKLGVNSVDGTKIAMGSDARGDILYHGATDYARLAKGTSGQVLTMGANDPAWATAGGSHWTTVASGTLNGATELIVANLTGPIRIIMHNLDVDTLAGSAVRAVLSTNNGSSWITAGGSYTRVESQLYGSTFQGAETTSSDFMQCGATGGYMYIDVQQATTSTKFTQVTSISAKATSSYPMYFQSNKRLVAEDNDAVKIYSTSSNALYYKYAVIKL